MRWTVVGADQVRSHIIDADHIGVFQVPQGALRIALPGGKGGGVLLRIGDVGVGIEVARGMGVLHDEFGVMLVLGLHGEELPGVTSIDLPVGHTRVLGPLRKGFHFRQGHLSTHPDAEAPPTEILQLFVEGLHLLLGLQTRVGREVLGGSALKLK